MVDHDVTNKFKDCCSVAIPSCGIFLIIVGFDVYMVIRIMKNGIESVPGNQLLVMVVLNLMFLMFIVAWIVHGCLLVRHKTKETVSLKPRLLNGRLIRSAQHPTCPICLDEITETIQFLTPCQHQFHPHCLQDCVDNEIAQCPLCRKPITSVSSEVQH